MFNPLPIVAADFRANRAGTVAVVLLVALAVALGVAVSAQERALRQGSARAADPFDVLIGAPGSQTQLVLSTVYLQPASLDLVDGAVLREAANMAGVVYAAPVGFGDNYQGYPIVGTIAEFVTQGGELELTAGRPFARMTEAVVGAQVTDLAIGDRFEPVHGQGPVIDPEAATHAGFAYEVVGRMPELGNPWDRAILVPIEAVWWIHGQPTGHAANAGLGDDFAAYEIGPPFDGERVHGVPAIVVKPEGVADAYVVRQRFRGEETMALFPAEVLVQLYNILGDVRALMAGIAVLTQVLVIGAVLLAVFASLAQRRRQIGVLRALGASRSYVFASVWLHVSLMVALGALLGLGFGYAGAWALSAIFAAETAISLPVALTLREVGLVAVLIVVGLLLALVPAIAVYRQPVAAALRA
jgi:putative ABC transport system permease protein